MSNIFSVCNTRLIIVRQLRRRILRFNTFKRTIFILFCLDNDGKYRNINIMQYFINSF